MLLNAEWSERFIQACAKVRSARRRSLPAGQLVYSTIPDGRCWVVVAGYIELLDPRVEGNRFIRLILGRGGLFSDRPFGAGAFRGFISPQLEQAVTHGPTEVIEMGSVKANDPSDTLPLIERLRNGDRQALTDLFQRHWDRLRRMVELRMDARLQGRVDAS
jgi:hypothetical protein